MGEKDRALLDRVPEMVTISDPKGRVIYANPATELVSDFTPEEFVGRDPFETIHPEDRPRCEEALEALLRAPGLSLKLEHRIKHKNGEWRWVEGTFVSLFDDPEVGGILATVRDVTERRRAEKALEESEERHRLTVEGARDYAIITTDPEGKIESWSSGTEAIFGWTAEEVVGRPSAITFTHEDRKAGVPEMELAVASREGSAPDVRWHLRKDGSRVFIEGTTRVLRGSGEVGGPRGFVKVGQDVTERRRTQQALLTSEQKYRTLVENVSEHAIFMLDPDGVVTEWTEGARKVKGYSAEEVVGRHFSMFYTPEDVASGEPRRMLEEAASEGRTEREAWRVHKDGRRIWASEVVTAVRGAEGRPVGFTKMSRDLTERRVLEEERARLRDFELTARAEQAERERVSRELHDRVAHTMAVAHQSLELHAALAGSDPERAALKLEQAKDATRTALEQTRDLSAQLARSGAQETKGGVSAALGDLLQTHVPPGVESALRVAGDESRVPSQVGEQAYLVMREAVRNAVAHSGCGRVEAYLEVDEEELRGRVEDDGSGFDPRGYPDGEEGPSPTGVGLLSMRERTERLGGRLEIVSGPERGTKVEVRLPLED
jgi:PAS domain S-box-containing protein